MGDIDIRIKNFIRIDSVFAQLFNCGIYGGKRYIDPGSLYELDTTSPETLKLEDGQLRDLERLRDVQKLAVLPGGKAEFRVILGVEGQTGVNYYMPARCMELDALSYAYQCRRISENAKEKGILRKYSDGVPKGTRILPVTTLVFYYGKTPWDGPLSIYDMLDIPDGMENLERWVPDYRMNLIDVMRMTDEELSVFDGDLGVFLYAVRKKYGESWSKRRKPLVANHRETWYAISAVTGNERYAEYIDDIPDEKMEGGVSMDDVLDCAEAKGEEIVSQLALKLFNAGKMDDFIKSAEDAKYREQLFIEYGLKKQR